MDGLFNVGGWMDDYVGGQMDGWMSDWDGWMNRWLNVGRINEWVGRWMNGWICV